MQTGLPPPAIRSVVIVGGGFSGTLQAINLLRHDGPRAILIERRPEVGRGVAYSAADPSLLLNVRAANMSALPDRPDHFTRWLERQGLPADGFVPRVTYGAYLADLLQETRDAAPDRLKIVTGSAVRADTDADGVTVTLEDGRTIAADALVLALGNLPPVPPGRLDPDRLPAGSYAPDPWAASIDEGLRDDDTVVILGTGLTMVDAALLLDTKGFRGTIVALSRRGLLPRAHGVGAPVPGGLSERPPVTVTALLREVRARAVEIGWRAAVDELRPYTRNLWLAASDEQRARFLRHLRPWWEVHRHRLAPAVAEKLERMLADGRLRIEAGKLQGADILADDRLRVRWRPRGDAGSREAIARRIVNCSGPQVDVARTDEPLLRQLSDDGLIVADTSCLGLAVDRDTRLIDATGAASDRLYALGPMTRGSFWEITAVPDIRVQTWELARRLSNAHWVGGEGL